MTKSMYLLNSNYNNTEIRQSLKTDFGNPTNESVSKTHSHGKLLFYSCCFQYNLC